MQGPAHCLRFVEDPNDVIGSIMNSMPGSLMHENMTEEQQPLCINSRFIPV